MKRVKPTKTVQENKPSDPSKMEQLGESQQP